MDNKFNHTNKMGSSDQLSWINNYQVHKTDTRESYNLLQMSGTPDIILHMGF